MCPDGWGLGFLLDLDKAGALGRGGGGEERLYCGQPTLTRFSPPGQGRETGGKGTPTRVPGRDLGLGPQLPSPLPLRAQRGQIEERNQAHIWKASGAPDVPGPQARLRKRGGEPRRSPPRHRGPPAPRRGLGVCRASAPLAAGFHQQFGLGSPRGGNPAQSRGRQGDDPVFPPAPPPRPEAGGWGRRTDRHCLPRAQPPFLSRAAADDLSPCPVPQPHDNLALEGIMVPIFWRRMKLRPWIRIPF